MRNRPSILNMRVFIYLFILVGDELSSSVEEMGENGQMPISKKKKKSAFYPIFQTN